MSGMSAECHAVVDSLGSGAADTRTGLRMLDGSDGAARLHLDDRRFARDYRREHRTHSDRRNPAVRRQLVLRHALPEVHPGAFLPDRFCLRAGQRTPGA